jgi:hypothetical protein
VITKGSPWIKSTGDTVSWSSGLGFIQSGSKYSAAQKYFNYLRVVWVFI